MPPLDGVYARKSTDMKITWIALTIASLTVVLLSHELGAHADGSEGDMRGDRLLVLDAYGKIIEENMSLLHSTVDKPHGTHSQHHLHRRGLLIRRRDYGEFADGDPQLLWRCLHNHDG